MEVWDESEDRRVPLPRIRRSWSDRARLFIEVIGGIAVAVGLFAGLMTSMGFKVTGSADDIVAIRASDTLRDTAIAQLRRQTGDFGSRLDDVYYLVCETTKRDHPAILLPRGCK